jgi:hypothetical protein
VIDNRTPMRWPSEWTNPSALDILSQTPVNYLLVERKELRETLSSRAAQLGVTIADPATVPPGVTVIRGEWPGVKLTESGMMDRAAAGPTGNPWVDSNGWRIRLAEATQPESSVWVDAAPQPSRLSAESYILAFADAAAWGARWIISLDSRLASEIAAGGTRSLAIWKRLAETAGFFASNRRWEQYVPQAVIGIVSDFSGPNEFMSHELLNLLARANQQYRIIPETRMSESSLAELKAVLYADDEPPAQQVRAQVLSFVEKGGLLVAGPGWGRPMDGKDTGEGHPRFALFQVGKGRIALARPELDDPYIFAGDSVVLMSHRHELLRFWNGGAVGSSFSVAPDHRRALVQMLFYAAAQFGNPTVRIAGKYRTGKLWTLDRPTSQEIPLVHQGEAVEVHLPPVSRYAAVELEV